MFKHVFTLLLALVLLCACAASTEQEGSESAPGVSGSASSEASVSEESFASDAGVGESAEESSVESVADSEDSVASSLPEESEEPNESSLPEESEEPVEPSQPEESEEPVEPSQPEESEEPVKPSQPEESEEPNESSEEEPPETADVKYVAVDSLSEPVLMLPCHTRDNLPTDFILAMQNNPVDIDLWEAYAETLEWDLIYDEFATLWDAEVQQAARDLIDVLGTQYEESVYKYVEDALDVGQAKCAYDSIYYLNPDGLWLGTYVLLGINANGIDVYRQTAFRLKYFMYLVETADGGTAERSLRFVHTAKEQGEGDPLVVITADDGFAVRAPYSPSYTPEYGTDFIKAMANNPIDTKGNATPDAFEAEIKYALGQLEPFIPKGEHFVFYMQDYVSAYMELIRFDANWFSVLHDLGYVTEDLHAQEEVAGYRQLLFSLKYWIYVFETANYIYGMEPIGEPNLAFTFSQ